MNEIDQELEHDWNHAQPTRAKLVISNVKRKLPFEAHLLPLDAHLLTADLKIRGVEIDFETADGIVITSLLNLCDDLRLEIEDKEISRSIIKYNKELINAITMIVKYYTSNSLLKEEDNG